MNAVEIMPNLNPVSQQASPFNRFQWIKFDSVHHNCWENFWTVTWYVSLVGIAALSLSGITLLFLHQQAFGALFLGFTLGGIGVAVLEYCKQKAEEAASSKKLSESYEQQPANVPPHLRSLSAYENFWTNRCLEYSIQVKEIKQHPENYDLPSVQLHNAKREAAKAKVHAAFYKALILVPSFQGEMELLCTLYEKDYPAQAVAEKEARFYKDPLHKAFLVFKNHEATFLSLDEAYKAKVADLASVFQKTIQEKALHEEITP